MPDLNKIRLIFKKAALISLLVFLLAVFLLPNITLAESGPDQLLFGGTETKTRVQNVLGLGSEDPRIIIASVIRVILGFLGILAVILIMYGGWLYMTSEGDEGKIETAINVIKNAAIGLVIILSAFAIATFALNWLYRGTTGQRGPNGDGSPDSGRGIGIIGACSVESVFPEPYQDDVPRNTAIIVTFKEEVRPESICADLTNGNCSEGSSIVEIEGLPVVRIYQSAQSDRCSDNNQENCLAARIYTRDNKTFVFMPENYLGSPSENIWHTVHLTNDILSIQNEGIFSHCRSQDYLEWTFNVSTRLDLTPPKILQANERGIFPMPDSSQDENDIPKNSIIKINFNESINPFTVSGDSQSVSSFIRIVCENCINNTNEIFDCGNGRQCVRGNFEISNQYKTVEFISDNKCGTNNCGEDIYCLPGGQNIRVELNAASLAVSCNGDNDCVTRNPYSQCGANNICQDQNLINYPMGRLDGVLDLSMNSLDGNRNNNAEGNNNYYNENTAVGTSTPGDNYSWSFWTSTEMRLEAPEITNITQQQQQLTDIILNSGNINLFNPFNISFNELMMSSSLRTSPAIILGVTHPGVNIYVLDENNTISTSSSTDYWLTTNDIGSGNQAHTVLYINHDILFDNNGYRIKVGSRAKDIYQNCYMPCVGPGCSGTPSCCNGTPTNNSTCE